MKFQTKHIYPMQLFIALAKARAFIMLSSLVYAAALIYCLSSYAAIEWGMYGFSFGDINALDIVFLVFAISIWSLVLPRKIDRPSSLFLIIIYLFLCIPGAVSMIGLERSSEDSYYLLLLSLTLGFSLSCFIARTVPWQGVPRSCSNISLISLTLAWVVLFSILLYLFGSIMTFAGLDDIYLQRDRGSAGSLLEGYMQTYFGYVISPILLAAGLAQKRYILIAMGICGAIVLYMITAEKAVFMYPLFVIALFLMLRSKTKAMTFVSSIAITFSVALLFSVYFYAQSPIASFVSWYLGVRSLLIPGVFVTYYSNYFNEQGYTFFSHVSGINFLVDPPSQLAANLRWPSIGHMVGEDYLGIPTLNANASFIASDGVASMGIVGVLVVFLLFTIFLLLLDRCSRGVRADLLLPLLVPLALTITNGSLFTAMTSFGGIFLLLFLRFGFRKTDIVLPSDGKSSCSC